MKSLGGGEPPWEELEKAIQLRWHGPPAPSAGPPVERSSSMEKFLAGPNLPLPAAW